MGYWQPKLHRSGKSMTLNSTYKVDLPEHGRLGSILLEISGGQVSGLGQNGGNWRILDFIDTIEVWGDGSDPLFSLTGKQAQLAAFLDQKIVAPSRYRNYATNTQFAYFLLNFGQHLKDKKGFLPLGEWDSVEFWLKNVATSSEFSDLTIDVILMLLMGDDEPSLPDYLLRWRKWKEWTTVADEWKYSTLPTDRDIRRIVLQAIPDVDSDNVAKTAMHNLMDDIDYRFRTGRDQVYRGSLEHLMHLNYYELSAEAILGVMAYVNADKGFDVGLGRVIGWSGISGSKDGAASATIPTIEADRSDYTQKAETYEADSPIHLLFKGLAYQNCALFGYDKEPDLSDVLNMDFWKNVTLDIHTRNQAASADGKNYICLQTVQRF